VLALENFFDFGLFGAGDAHYKKLPEFFAFVILIDIGKLNEWS